MSLAAVFGAGSIGSAIAHRLAERGRVSDILIIDDNPRIAEGKALDILQSGPIAGSDTRLLAAGDALAAAGASVVVLADDTVNGPWDGERGLALVAQLIRAGAAAPFVFAAPSQLPLMEAAARELHAAPDRLIGTAASAIEPIVASLVNIELGETGTVVSVVGRPPALVVGWSAATIGGSLVSERVPAHRLLAISQSLPRFWPPGAQAIAAPTARVVEALIAGSRRLLPAVTMLDGELGVRGRAGLLPLELGRGRVLRRVVPSLSPQERTETVTGLMWSRDRR
jgi:malate dehydrogenase